MHNLKIHFFLFSTIAPKRLKSSHSSKIRFIIILSLSQIYTDNSSFQATGILILPLSKNSEGVKDPSDQCGEIQHSSLCSYGVYHKPFEACLVAAVHRAGIVGIDLVILLFHVVKIVHYQPLLVSGAVTLLQRRTKQAIGLGMTGITLLDMLD